MSNLVGAAAMQATLFDETVHSRPQRTDPLATQLATFEPNFITSKPLIRDFVGRPGLDPGTLGLKVPTYVSTQSVQAQILGF